MADPLEMSEVVFPLRAVKCAGVTLAPGLALECYHLTNGRGEFTADGNSTQDSATETVMCKLMEPPGEFMYFEISYKLVTSAHCGGIEEMGDPRIAIIRGDSRLVTQRKMVERRLIELLAKNPASICSEIGIEEPDNEWVHARLERDPYRLDILATDPDAAENHLEQCLRTVRSTFSSDWEWDSWLEKKKFVSKWYGLRERGKPKPKPPSFFVTSRESSRTIAPGILGRDPARIYCAFALLADAAEAVKLPKSPYGIERTEYAGKNPLLRLLSCMNEDSLSDAVRELEAMLATPGKNTLNLRGMEIQSLPTAFFGDRRVIAQLKHLDCRDNRLTEITDDIRKCTALTTLKCDRNQIEVLSEDLGGASRWRS